MPDQPEQDPTAAGLSEDDLVEAEAEMDIIDADLEEYDEPVPVADREPVVANLSEEELAEAEAESDVTDADLEGA